MTDWFKYLHPGVQKWIYKQNWNDLRDIQKQAIEPILSASSDVIISASTAAGKTEAAFLPACSVIAEQSDGFGILYISPLKALINDQYRRLGDLCDLLDMEVTPWHGDSSQSKKKHAKLNPQGILLITPESLESLMIRQPGWIKSSFAALKYIIIDEYHAFVGFERGYHLQSLLHRLEHLLQREKNPISRIALSATLSDIDSVISYLRPLKTLPFKIITGKNDSIIKIQMRGYVEPTDAKNQTAHQKTSNDLYKLLRGDSHLVFANSRKRTELFTVMLSDLCKQNNVPNEFFAHHGSLSKNLREELESRLQKEDLPTTAICTMTLELGIDIGKVQSVAQLNAPHSVTSLRQRLGRSGRRGEPAALRVFIAEKELDSKSHLNDMLRLELLQSIAMVKLLIQDKWYEPPDLNSFHFSTLLHQILATIAQWGSVRASQLWELLCTSGIFDKITINHFKALLSHMGEEFLIFQTSSGELVLGYKGEQLVNHYSFYAVFNTPEEYRIIFAGRTLGTLPVDSLILPKQHIIFAGKRWEVVEINEDKKTIHIKPAAGGNPPNFGGNGMFIHDRIRQEMFNIYKQQDYKIKGIDFLNETARSLFNEGLECFKALSLESKHLISYGNYVYIVPWMGDKLINTLTAIVIKNGYEASNFGGVIEIKKGTESEIANLLKKVVRTKPTNMELARSAKNKKVEKYDEFLSEDLLNEGYGAKAFDIDNTINWILSHFK